MRKSSTSRLDKAMDATAKKQRGVLQARKQLQSQITNCRYLNVRVGRELFRFASFPQWVNKAQSWFRDVRCGYVCIDGKGRICQKGREFMRARDDESFPVVVYEIE